MGIEVTGQGALERTGLPVAAKLFSGVGRPYTPVDPAGSRVYDVLKAGATVLAAMGYAIELCPDYGPEGRRPGEAPSPPVGA